MAGQQTKPLTRPLLDEMIRDPRYGNSKHPGHADWVKLVTKGFNILYSEKAASGTPGAGRRKSDNLLLFGGSASAAPPARSWDQPVPLSMASGGTGASPTLDSATAADGSDPPSGAGGAVHVRAYVRYVNGQPVDVSEYDRSVAPGGEAFPGPEASQQGTSPEDPAPGGDSSNPLGPYADVASSADCEYQRALDEMRCRTFPNATLSAQCWANAMERYAACGRGRPLPPLFPR